jgi:hypothetical protein
MVGSIDTHDGEDGFSAIELPRVSAQLNFRGPSKPAEEIRSGTVVLLDDGPGHLIDERRAADKAHPAAWTREFRWLSGRSDFTSTAIDVHGLLLFQCPTHPVSRREN